MLGRCPKRPPSSTATVRRCPTLSCRAASPRSICLAGQSLALAAALSTALKFRGSFSVQAKGDGAVPMLLADCTDTGALRGYARSSPDKLDALLRGNPTPAADQLL